MRIELRTIPLMRAWIFMLAASLWTGCAAEKMALVRPAQYKGMADASGGAAVSSNLFVVADDEQNILRVYQRDGGGRPVKEFDVNAFLEVEGDSPEADLEGCARIGERIYWIGSHGRNKNGKPRPNRCRFFATELSGTNGDIALNPVGKPCKRLLSDLLADRRYARFELAKAAEHAPKTDGALNIEGLSATAEGHLLIGFRNPVPDGKALVAPLLNPVEVIEGNPARFGEPILLDLAGIGIRDMAYYDGCYLIIAGSWHGGGQFQLYRWKGGQSRPEPIKVKHLGDYNPEGIIIYPDKGLDEFQIVSDDGKLEVDGVPGKQVMESATKSFRSFWITAKGQ